MKREEFEHTIRAAASVLGVREVLVIGSQALHASVDGELPIEASRSVEVDVAVLSGDAQALRASGRVTAADVGADARPRKDATPLF